MKSTRRYLLWIFTLVALLSLTHGQNMDPRKQIHAVVVDAGSTGTRANYYVFKLDPSAPFGLKLVSKSSEKVEPGLSSYKDNVAGAVQSVTNLLNTLISKQPQSTSALAEMDLEATAGMRLLKLVDTTKAQHIIDTLHTTLKTNFSHFHLCQECVIISRGVEEGLYAYMTINILLGLMNTTKDPLLLHGVMEMGGASTQIAIPLSPSSTTGSNLCPKSPIPNKFSDTLAGQCVYVKSYFPMGVNMAEYILHGISEDCVTKTCTRSPNTPVISPCYHPEFLKEMTAGATQITLKGDPTVTDGQKRYDLCYSLIRTTIKEKKLIEKLSDLPYRLQQPVYLISAFYHALKSFKNNEKSFQIALKEITPITRQACTSVAKSGKYEPYYCFRLAFFESLFRDGYGFTEDQIFIAADQINGIEIDWTYAAAIEIILHNLNNKSTTDKYTDVVLNLEVVMSR